MRERNAIRIEFSISPIEADVVGAVAIAGPVRHDDVRQPAPIEVRHVRVSSRPFRFAIRAAHAKVAMTVIQIHKLGIGRIVADNHVEVSIAVHIGKRPGIGTIRRVTQVMGEREPSIAVIQQNAPSEWPMRSGQ